jgi:hypothetical protein
MKPDLNMFGFAWVEDFFIIYADISKCSLAFIFSTVF